MDQILVGKGEQPVSLLAKYGNRHGLVAGATGTGKTVSLMVLAEGFSRLGVPVFMADVKGDVAGLAHGRQPEREDPAARRPARHRGLRARGQPGRVLGSSRQARPSRAHDGQRDRPEPPRRASSSSTTPSPACSRSPSSSPTTGACCCSISTTCGPARLRGGQPQGDLGAVRPGQRPVGGGDPALAPDAGAGRRRGASSASRRSS